jgi:hypothetical protein
VSATLPARLLVVLPPEETALALLDTALAMAERLERELVALLVEDRRLLASAALPFTRIVSRTGAAEREFDVAATERMLRVVAERARHRLAEVAGRRSVRWRFETTRELETLTFGEGDVLAVATLSTAWVAEPPARLPGPVLLMGRAGGPLVLVHRGGRTAPELARELARRAQLPLVVLAGDESAAAEARAVLGEEARIETCPIGNGDPLGERLRALAPGLVLIDAREDGAAWRAAVEAVRAAATRPAG